MWHWFVDRLASAKTRVGQDELIKQALVYAADIRELHRIRAENGEVDPSSEPKLPKIDEYWVYRWRYKHSVTFRTVNLRYKISRKMLLSRLRVFWGNCIRVRALHRALHGPDKLRFVGFDQKPLWFNSLVAEKTLAGRGSKMVPTTENVSDSRIRFTVMTHVRSLVEDTAPKIAVLFKGAHVVG